jgi:hypothetical protein
MSNSLPFWIPLLQALAVPTIALLAAVIGYFQWKTAQQKVVLDLFDRRMETYTSLRSVVAMVMGSSGAATNENSFKFLEALDRAQFLFGSEVIEYLKKLDAAINEIRMSVAERIDLASGPEREANIARERAGREMVASFYTTFQSLVSPYLRMDQKSSWLPWS